MSVHINEPNPETRAKVLPQIGETVMKQSFTTPNDIHALTNDESAVGMSAKLILLNNHSSTYTDAEKLARQIISRMDSVAAKLKSLEDDIRRLWVEFDNLAEGETILGCRTKKEFCEKKLHRTPRAIQYLLAGQSNPADRPHKQSELSSPPESPSVEPSEAEPKIIQPGHISDDAVDEFVNRLGNPKLPAKFAKKPWVAINSEGFEDALDRFVNSCIAKNFGQSSARAVWQEIATIAKRKLEEPQ